VRDHEVRLLHLAIVIRSGLDVTAARALGGLGIGPCEILVAALLVSFALYLVVARPLARYLATVRYVVADLGEARDRPGLQHDGERKDLADAEYALQLGIGLLQFHPVFDNRLDLIDLAGQMVDGLLADGPCQRKVLVVRQVRGYPVLTERFHVARLELEAVVPANNVLQAHDERSPQLHQVHAFPQKIADRPVFPGVDVSLGQNAEPQHVAQPEGIVLIIGMLKP